MLNLAGAGIILSPTSGSKTKPISFTTKHGNNGNNDFTMCFSMMYEIGVSGGPITLTFENNGQIILHMELRNKR